MTEAGAGDAVDAVWGQRIGTVPPAEVFGRDGVALFQAMMAGEIPTPPIMSVAPLRPVEVEHGRIVFEAMAQDRHYNPIGSVHGGFAATVLDTVMSCAVHSTLKAGEGYTTIEMRAAFHRAIQADGRPLRAEGTVTSRGGRIGAADGRILDADGRLLASGATTCLIFPVTSPPVTPPPEKARP